MIDPETINPTAYTTATLIYKCRKCQKSFKVEVKNESIIGRWEGAEKNKYHTIPKGLAERMLLNSNKEKAYHNCSGQTRFEREKENGLTTDFTQEFWGLGDLQGIETLYTEVSKSPFLIPPSKTQTHE